MELTIDSKPCDLAGEPIAVGGYAAAELADVEAAREGRSQEFTPVSYTHLTLPTILRV